MLLDLNLPDGSGLAALREARSRGDRTPVLVLTARNRIDERIAGLDAGADDYLGKPFELGELAARLRALVRRAKGVEALTEVGGAAPRPRRRALLRRSPATTPSAWSCRPASTPCWSS